MLKRLYVDNYKGLVNFELNLDGHALLMGANGSGKSTILEVLDKLKLFVCRELPVDLVFVPDCLTRWQTRTKQTFELDLETPAGTFLYRLVVDSPSIVAEEVLRLGDVELVRASGGAGEFVNKEGQRLKYLTMEGGSLVGTIGESHASKELLAFRAALNSVLLLMPDPRTMSSLVGSEERTLAPNLSNFASWWRYAWSAFPEEMGAAIKEAGATLPGLRSLSVQPRESDGSRVLRTKWDVGTASVEFAFHELSDGQKVIIGMNAAAAWLRHGGGTLLLDEPDNFVALPEIQPLLRGLLDVEGVQLVVASHHPKVLNELAVEHGLRMWREQNGPVRVEKFAPPADTMLTPAEMVASRLDVTDG